MLKRYARTPIIRGGQQYGTSTSVQRIREGIKSGRINIEETRTLKEGERLDVIAGKKYNGRSDLAWVIAAASNIGWMLQVPPGTEIKIPRLADVSDLVGG